MTTAAIRAAAATACCLGQALLPEQPPTWASAPEGSKQCLDPRPVRGGGPGAVRSCPLAGAPGAASCSALRFLGSLRSANPIPQGTQQSVKSRFPIPLGSQTERHPMTAHWYIARPGKFDGTTAVDQGK